MTSKNSGNKLVDDRQSLGAIQAMLALIALAAALSLFLNLRGPQASPEPSALPATQSSAGSGLGNVTPVEGVPIVPNNARPLFELPYPEVNFGDLSFRGEGIPETLPFVLTPLAPPARDEDLAALIAQADQALIQSLARFGLDLSHVLVNDEETRLGPDKETYLFRKLVVLPPEAWGALDADRAFALVQSMADSLRIWAPDFRLQQINSHLYFIMKDELVTHAVQLGPEDELTPPRRDADLPRLVIVMDDMGESLSSARRLAALPYPVTFAIWPLSTHASFTANLAEASGLQVLIHLPMEPLNASSQAIEPDTLFVGVNQDQMLEIISNALYLLPEAEGLNNHMGSRFTSDLDSMDLFCAMLAQLRPDFLVLDSRTHQDSLFYQAADAAGLRAFSRNLFLDEVDTAEAVSAQLDKAAQLARDNGLAIAIGHPRPATLEALEAWQGYRGPEIAIVPLGYPNDNQTGNDPEILNNILTYQEQT